MLYDRRIIPRSKIKMVKKKEYSFWIGTVKVLKNAAIFLLPSLVAYQTNVPVEYAGVLSVIIYYLKNYVENR
jgi:hypothetical protein